MSAGLSEALARLESDIKGSFIPKSLKADLRALLDAYARETRDLVDIASDVAHRESELATARELLIEAKGHLLPHAALFRDRLDAFLDGG